MAGLFEGLDLSRRMQNPLVQMGAQMLANSGPSLQPKGLFEGVPQAISRSIQMQQDQKKLDADEKARTDVINLMREQNPEMAAMIEAGNLDAKSAIAMIVDRQQREQDRQWQLEDFERKRALGGEGENFFGTPLPFSRDDGSIGFVQLGNRGSTREIQMPDGGRPAPTTRQVDIGTHIITQDVYGNELSRTPKENYQEAYDTRSGTEAAVIDAGAPERQSKALGALGTLERQWVVVGSDIDRAIDQAGQFSTTGVLSLTSAVPGTPAFDLAQTLNTIKANIGFDYLQQMRENSPTGGALGSVTENELALLQAVNGATAQGQTADQLVRNLHRIKELQAIVLQERRDAYQRDYGGAQQPNANPMSYGDLRTKYGLE